MFLQASVILSTGGGRKYLTRYTPPPGPGAPRGTRYTPWDQVHPPWRRACWEIRSTCGRYASYWNAIFVSHVSVHGGLGPGGVRLWTPLRSPSGRYASYWNAFLFSNKTCLKTFVFYLKLFSYTFPIPEVFRRHFLFG